MAVSCESHLYDVLFGVLFGHPRTARAGPQTWAGRHGTDANDTRRAPDGG
jgi:hypothetical protein